MKRKAATMSGKEVRALRTRLGLSQTELAKKLGMNRSIVAHWETGRCTPNGAAAILMRMLGKNGVKSPVSQTRRLFRNKPTP
jgi:putative transcriptional regulator